MDLHKNDEHRPWGFYTVLTDGADHKVKRIVVFPGKRLSLQRHLRREEHWYVVSGELMVTTGEKTVLLRAGESIDIPFGAIHRLENTGHSEASLIEIQRGDYFGEDDIERLEDDYGRI
ncbi:MAG: phosphomannose isomerase type II C-terminal cupin domain [Candidatus Latescibacterota bacterium]